MARFVCCTACYHCKSNSFLAHACFPSLLLVFTCCASVFLLVLEKYHPLRVDQSRLEGIAKKPLPLRPMSDCAEHPNSCFLLVLDRSPSKLNCDQWTSSCPATHHDKVKAADIPVLKQCCQTRHPHLNVLCWVIASPAFYRYSTNTNAFEDKRPLMLGHLKFVFSYCLLEPLQKINCGPQCACEIGITVDSLKDSPKATKWFYSIWDSQRMMLDVIW